MFDGRAAGPFARIFAAEAQHALDRLVRAPAKAERFFAGRFDSVSAVLLTHALQPARGAPALLRHRVSLFEQPSHVGLSERSDRSRPGEHLAGIAFKPRLVIDGHVRGQRRVRIRRVVADVDGDSLAHLK